MEAIVLTSFDEIVSQPEDMDFRIGVEQTFKKIAVQDERFQKRPFQGDTALSYINNFHGNCYLNGCVIWKAEISDIIEQTNTTVTGNKRKALQGGYVIIKEAEILFYKWFVKQTFKYWDCPDCVKDFVNDEEYIYNKRRASKYFSENYDYRKERDLEFLCLSCAYTYFLAFSSNFKFDLAQMKDNIDDFFRKCNDENFTKEMVEQKFKYLVMDFMD